MFVVFDLDGTLADCTHRIHHIRMPESVEGDYPQQDWRAFHAGCKDDAPIEPILSVARSMIADGHAVEIWTGRGDQAREDTIAWLLRHGIRAAPLDRGVPLVMRRGDDHTPDHKLKRSWLDQRGRPDVIFEDRASVVAMWRAEGIICCQVAPGDF